MICSSPSTDDRPDKYLLPVDLVFRLNLDQVARKFDEIGQRVKLAFDTRATKPLKHIATE